MNSWKRYRKTLLLFGTECFLNLLQPAALESLKPFVSFLRSGSTSPPAFVAIVSWPAPYLWLLHRGSLVARGDEWPVGLFHQCPSPLASLFPQKLGHYKSAARLAQMPITATHSSTLFSPKANKAQRPEFHFRYGVMEKDIPSYVSSPRYRPRLQQLQFNLLLLEQFSNLKFIMPRFSWVWTASKAGSRSTDSFPVSLDP